MLLLNGSYNVAENDDHDVHTEDCVHPLDPAGVDLNVACSDLLNVLAKLVKLLIVFITLV